MMLTTTFPLHRWPWVQALLVFTLVIVGLYTYGFFGRGLGLGFDWSGTQYQVVWALPSLPIQPGDLLVQLGPVKFDDFEDDLRLSILDAVQPGQAMPAVVIRNGQTLTLNYLPPGFTLPELMVRVPSQWWLGWLFWGVGALTYFSVRPKDTRWYLLIAFFCVTAIWLSASAVSRLHLWESAIVLRMAIWLSVPVYWHLHWVFPERLPQLPRWPLGRTLGYVAAFGLAALEWFQLLPTGFYVLGFAVAFLGLLVPLVVRLFKPAQARRARGLWVALLISVVPALVLALFAGSGSTTLNALVALLALPALPLGYFYTAYRPQLGWLELRANRVIALFLFVLTLSLGAALVLPVVFLQFPTADVLLIVMVSLVVLTGLVSALGFPAFQRWVERRLLGIPSTPQHLLGHFLARITTSLDYATLTHVLEAEIAPSLQITQSALALWVPERQWRWLYSRNVPVSELPDGAALEHLDAQVGRGARRKTPSEPELAWVRVALRLAVEEKVVGWWLLGRRDPDDVYAQSEVDYLQVLANQTALTLTLLAQTEQLRQLYQTDIDRWEAEQTRLAHDLHDVVLKNFATVRNSVGLHPPPGFLEAYEMAVERLRQAISGLRPPLLDYGLYQALKALAGDHEERPEPIPALVFEVAESAERYDLKVEEHIYRIVQQAYENALAHARAKTLRLSGRLEPEQIVLLVEDDGGGWPNSTSPGIESNGARRHFGVLGMQERAGLINAELKFEPLPAGGLQVQLRWSRNHAAPVSTTAE